MKVLIIFALVACCALVSARSRHHSYEDDHYDSRHHSDEDSHHDSGHDSREDHHSDEDDHYDSHPAGGHDSHYEGDYHGGHDNHIYRFHFGHENGAYGFQDEHGEYHGLWIDYLKAVCRHAHKKCHWVLDRYDHCWTQDEHYEHYEYPGMGILDHWYDACFGWTPTHERHNALNFSLPLHPPSNYAVYIDADKFEGDHHELAGKTAGHVRGWINVGECFDHEHEFKGHLQGEYKLHNYDTLHDVIEAMHKGEVDFMLASTDSLKPEHEHLTQVGHTFTCSEQGYALMARYGEYVLEWWNENFHELELDGTIYHLCHQASTKYGAHGGVNC